MATLERESPFSIQESGIGQKHFGVGRQVVDQLFNLELRLRVGLTVDDVDRCLVGNIEFFSDSAVIIFNPV